MIFNLILNHLFTLVKVVFGWINLPSFDLSAFDTYIVWFRTFLDSAVSLLAFLIPRPVFRSSIVIALFIYSFDHIFMILKWVIGFIPLIGTGVARKE